MSEWQDPWESPQLFSAPELLEDPEFTRARIQERHAARMASRYYCPVCGEVQFGYRSPIQGWVVDSHVKCVPTEGRQEYFYKRCPGGRIDKEKDKAP